MSSLSLSHRRHEFPMDTLPQTPKARKQWEWTRPVQYLLKEQRLLFVLVGMAFASALFFLQQPQHRFGSTVVDTSKHRAAALSERRDINYYKDAASSELFGNSLGVYDSSELFGKQQHMGIISTAGAKVPLGLKRTALRVVVTGGAGFVGSHLVDKLIARGDSVIVVDNFFTGRKENVMHHFGNPRFELIRHDVVETLLLEVDQIYHLACPASPVHYKFNPVKTIISSSTHVCSSLFDFHSEEGSKKERFSSSWVDASLHLIQLGLFLWLAD
jgi:UDP-glucuronate decarboxylase